MSVILLVDGLLLLQVGMAGGGQVNYPQLKMAGGAVIPLAPLVGEITIVDGVATLVANAAKVVVGLGVVTLGAGITLLTMDKWSSPFSVVQLNDTQRFVFDKNSELSGSLQEKSSDGQWLTIQTNVQLGRDSNNQYVALTQDDLQKYIQPTTTPTTPPQPPTGVPPVVSSTGNTDTTTPGTAASPPSRPTVIATPVDTPTAADLLIDKSNSKILGDNLEANGEAKPADGYDAHHIVLSNGGGALMDALRARLTSWGIDINSAVNGLWLPGSDAPEGSPEPYHERLHNNAYFTALDGAFVGVDSKEDAIKVLNDIKDRLKDGTFSGVRPRP